MMTSLPCVFCPFRANSARIVSLHYDADHTKRVHELGEPPKCDCGFLPYDWTGFQMHLWDRHGGGLRLRPDKSRAFESRELRELLQSASSASLRSSADMNMNVQGYNGHQKTRSPSRSSGSRSPRPSSNSDRRDYRSPARNRNSYRSQAVARYSNMGREHRERVSSRNLYSVSERTCYMCDKVCPTSDTLRRHNLQMHPDNQCVVYTCTKCKCEFVIRRTARTHLREHGISDNYDLFTSVRNARPEELPLHKCASFGCPFRSSDASLVDHDSHKNLIYAQITDTERQQVEKGQIPDSFLDVPREKGYNTSPKKVTASNGTQEKTTRMVDCIVQDGHITVPVDNMRGRFILVSADPNRVGDDLIINIKDPQEPHEAIYNMLLDNLGNEGIKQLGKVLQRHIDD